MKKRTSRLLSILLTLVMLLGLVPALSLTASAYSGSGTATNPYVATTYDEVRTLVADAPTDGTTRYIKLGANVVSSSNTDNNDIKLGKDNRQRVVLDLAGHSITRSETTSDCDVICVSAGYLTIQDSVGSGRVVEDIKVASAKTIPNTLYVFGSGHLTIESGTFESKNGCAIEGRGVSTVIDGGTFTSSNNFGVAMFYAGNLTVNGGNFQGEGRYGIFFTPPAVNCVINACTVSLKQSGGLISSNGAVRIKKCLGADSKVVNANGKEFRLDTACEITGTYCRITRPTITINSIDITGIDAPVTDQPLDFTADCDTVGVKSVSVYWYNLSDKKTVSEGEVAKGGKTYRVDVDLLPQTGYRFVGDKSEVVTINGEEAYIFGGTTEDLSVSYTFSETAAGKPVITKQPAAASGQVGSPMTFSVTATGATGYNWYIYDAGDAQAYSWSSIRQYATVSGESTSKITITPTDTWLNGKVLDCTIKGSGGFAYTDQAKMTVTAAPKTISTVAATGIDAPMIGSKPDTTAVAGSGNYTIAAVSWEPADSVFKDGTAYSVVVSLESKDGTKFAAAPVATINGQMARVVSGAGSQGLRISYTFPELEPGRINLTYDPSSVSTALGKTVTLSAFADIDFELTDNLKIQWYKVASNYYGTGTAIPGANDMAYTFKADKEETAYYYCEVSGRIMGEEYSSASDTAPMVWVTVAKAGTPVITTQPKSVSVKEGADVTFTVTAEGEGLSYQWYCEKNGGAAKVGTNGPTYTIKAANVPDDNGTVYYCVIHNKAGEATSEKATLTVSKLGAMTTFSDVPAGVWYTAAVDWAVEEEITNGTGGGKFSPTENCTHAQILTFLYRADRGVGTAAAEDMDKAVDWARGKGMIDASFNGAKECTRAEAVEYIWQALGKQDAKVSGFADVDAKAGYARAVDWAVDNGVTNGAGGGKFSPNTVCTRGHIVTFLHRAYVPEARV